MQTSFDAAPSLTVTVLDANRAMLVVSSNAEGGTVFVDGQPVRDAIRDGKSQSFVKPGVRRVKVEMDGYQDEPEQGNSGGQGQSDSG